MSQNRQHYKSSTNEGSLSNKLGKFKSFRMNSGSSSSPNSLRSIISSGYKPVNSLGAGLGLGVRIREADDRYSSNSLSSSFLDFKSQNQQRAHTGLLADSLSERRSIVSMPLVEYDTLGQATRKAGRYSDQFVYPGNLSSSTSNLHHSSSIAERLYS